MEPFDLLHYGHIALIAKARLLGLPVVIGLSTDFFNSAKGKTAVQSYQERKFFLEQLKGIGHIFPEEKLGTESGRYTKIQCKNFLYGK